MYPNVSYPCMYFVSYNMTSINLSVRFLLVLHEAEQLSTRY